MNSPRHDVMTFSVAKEQMWTCDQELLLAAKAGSHAAFERLQQKYSGRLYQRILSITRNREDAEDALQDTFIRAYRALPSFEGRAQLSSWLTRIAINSALMILRKRRARPEMSFEPQSNLRDDSPSIDLRDSAPDPEQVYDQNQRSQAILLAIQRLTPKLRTPIGMWISEEQSMGDLAQHLGISLASVKSRLHRARKHLRRSPVFRNHKMYQNPKRLGSGQIPAGS